MQVTPDTSMSQEEICEAKAGEKHSEVDAPAPVRISALPRGAQVLLDTADRTRSLLFQCCMVEADCRVQLKGERVRHTRRFPQLISYCVV